MEKKKLIFYKQEGDNIILTRDVFDYIMSELKILDKFRSYEMYLDMNKHIENLEYDNENLKIENYRLTDLLNTYKIEFKVLNKKIREIKNQNKTLFNNENEMLNDRIKIRKVKIYLNDRKYEFSNCKNIEVINHNYYYALLSDLLRMVGE